jgi:dihydroxyacetone kinase-like predicted kinase
VREVVIVTADSEGLAPAFAAADQAERDLPGVRIAVIPGKAAVQAVAAIAVHEPGRRFEADVVAMTAAAGATRYGALRVAEDDAWTMAGVARAGDVLGFIEDDVALIAGTVVDGALEVVDRMVSAGGEMVTLVTGADLGLPTEDLVDAVTARVLARRLEMDVVAYEGGQSGWPLLIGVE